MHIRSLEFCVCDRPIFPAPFLFSKRRFKPRPWLRKPTTDWRKLTRKWEKQKKPVRKLNCSSKFQNRKRTRPNASVITSSSLCTRYGVQLLHRLRRPLNPIEKFRRGLKKLSQVQN